MGTPGRPPGQPHTGGRRKGTLNKNQLTEEMRKSITTVFRRMGGTKWLLTWAQENPTEFVRLVLSRVLPAPPREEADVSVAIGVQVDNMPLTEAAARVAFLLARAAHESGVDPAPPTRTLTVEPEPVAPVDTIPVLPPSADPIEDRPPTGFTYAGSAREQGREPVRKRVVTKGRRSLL